MKKQYTLLFFSLFICAFTTLFAGNKDGKILMYARLSGANEVPAVNTNAKGLVTFMLAEDYKTMTINGVFDSLSGPITGCHFHTGAIGVNGPVTVNLMSLVNGNQIDGKITVNKALLAAIHSYGIYINVHTTSNPGGEIRGQVFTETDLHFSATMTGANEVPPVTTTATGLGSFVLNYTATKLEYKVLVAGLSGPITAAHLHYGEVGKAGPVIYPLTFTGNTLSGTLDVSDDFVDSLFNNKVYINVHTAANPAGEIRGQLTINSLITFDVEAIGANEVPAKVSPGRALAVGWIDGALDTLNYIVMYDSLTPTAGHFHTGAAGMNGPVTIPFTAVAGSRFFVGRVGLQPDTLANILKGNIYLNLHTSANPGGEIRGQTNTSVRGGLVANLCGEQEAPNPVNNTNGIGAGLLSIDRNKSLGHVEVVTTGLTGNATAGHIHIGAKGVAGPVVINLGINGASGNQASGAFIIPRATFADTILNGLTYYNVHTATNPNGEIRGQIAKELQPECSTITGIDELNGEQLAVKVFPNPMYNEINLVFESTEAFAAQVVMTDLLGRQMSTKSIEAVQGSNQISLNVNNLSSGIYLIQLRNYKGILFAQKVVKQ